MVLQRMPITKKLTRYAMNGPDSRTSPIALSSSRLLSACKSCGNRRSVATSVIATAKMPSVSASRRAFAIIAASASARDQHPVIEIEDHGGIVFRAGFLGKIGARPIPGGDRAQPQRADVAATG